MADINILSPHVADLIAAGEVVERPASVIKELLENSIDAGARNITVEIRDGGMPYLRVTDDGCGMLPEDAGVCFLRHATSKLKDEKGLERIGTMGFRGEALAAIAAVSKIELLTRRRGEENGTRVLVEAGEIADMRPFGCPEGTSVIIRDVFHNTPARLKFMKSDKAEATACAALALRCALGAPGVSIRYMRDDKEEFFSPGDGKAESCVYSLLGRELANGFIPCKATDEDISVTGFVGNPGAGQGSRAKQFFFCNGRAIRSPLLQAAVEQAYKNTLLTGRFPSCVIWLEISPAQVDVNVHPSKIEVKFREERRVFDAVHYAVLSALKNDGARPEIKLSNSTKAAIAPKKDFYKSMTAEEFRGSQSTVRSGTAGAKFAPPEIDTGTIIIDRRPAGKGGILHDGAAPYLTGNVHVEHAQAPELTPSAEPERDRKQRVSESEHAQNAVPQQERMAEPAPTSMETAAPAPESTSLPEDFRLIGEAMRTYILVEAAGSLILIDKHAAHERMIFDKLKKRGYDIMSQTLLVPVTVRASAFDVELVEKNSEMLSKMGLELEPFGEDSLVLRALPADTDSADAESLVEELCEKLRNGRELSPEDVTDEILHTIACKAAIKAGWNTTKNELEAIARAVISGEVKYCPHGRPVSATITRKQLDKEFSRLL